MHCTKLSEYMELALRSIKPHDSREMAICDWALGLGGETSEIADIISNALLKYPTGAFWPAEERMELAKELGDVLWYSFALIAELGLPVTDANFSEFLKMASQEDAGKITMGYETLRLVTSVGSVHESLKHHLMHHEALDSAHIAVNLSTIWSFLHVLSVGQGFTLEDVANLNVAKLSHRYNLASGGAYNHEASAERHQQETKFTDTVEYQELRKKILREE